MTHSMPNRRRPDAIHAQHLQFVGEQDGAPERELKQRLAQSLRPLGVRKAYLARVQYSGGNSAHGEESSVALCVALGEEAAERQEIVERAGADFGALFRPSQHMDIVFLTDQQDLAVSRVCRPFYMAMEDA